jgi:nucleoside-diphosphate-sugar epimerase
MTEPSPPDDRLPARGDRRERPQAAGTERPRRTTSVKTGSDLEGAMGREAPETVLITGSSGFLGQAIARGLTRRYRVIGLDAVEPRSPPRGMDTFRIDLTSDHEVAAAMREVRDATGGRVASVVHLAAYYDTTGEDNPKYDQVTVQGTRRLLDQLKWLDCGQLVFSSTMLVHKGGLRGVKIDETWPVEPAWAYPRSKAETERLIAAERGPIKSVVMRFAGVYDEDCRAAFIAQQIARIAERLPTAFLFTGDLGNGQPYLHVADMVDAVARGGAPPRAAGRGDVPDRGGGHPLLRGDAGAPRAAHPRRDLAHPDAAQGPHPVRRLAAGGGAAGGHLRPVLDGGALGRPLRARRLPRARCWAGSRSTASWTRCPRWCAG